VQVTARAHDGGQRLSVSVAMRWGDMDAYGHINLAFVDEATGRLLRLTEGQRDRLAPYVGAGVFAR
jgi:acyl-CoA thioesterase FadM